MTSWKSTLVELDGVVGRLISVVLVIAALAIAGFTAYVIFLTPRVLCTIPGDIVHRHGMVNLTCEGPYYLRIPRDELPLEPAGTMVEVHILAPGEGTIPAGSDWILPIALLVGAGIREILTRNQNLVFPDNYLAPSTESSGPRHGAARPEAPSDQ